MNELLKCGPKPAKQRLNIRIHGYALYKEQKKERKYHLCIDCSG